MIGCNIIVLVFSGYESGVVKYSSPKISEHRTPNKTNTSRHLLKVFIVSFAVVLIIQIIVLILIVALSKYIKTPTRFGIGFGSFQVFKHVNITYQFGSGLLVIPFILAAFNVLLHWLRKHARKKN